MRKLFCFSDSADYGHCAASADVASVRGRGDAKAARAHPVGAIEANGVVADTEMLFDDRLLSMLSAMVPSATVDPVR
jgi:hypothetical protein